jgi:hypothetical protein
MLAQAPFNDTALYSVVLNDKYIHGGGIVSTENGNGVRENWVGMQ